MTVCDCLWLSVSVCLSVFSWFPFVGAYLRSFSGHFYLGSRKRIAVRPQGPLDQPSCACLQQSADLSSTWIGPPTHLQTAEQSSADQSWKPRPFLSRTSADRPSHSLSLSLTLSTFGSSNTCNQHLGNSTPQLHQLGSTDNTCNQQSLLSNQQSLR